MSLTFEEFIAGWVGGIVGLVGSHPIDTFKVRKQQGILIENYFISTFRKEGLYGFYKGMTVPALMSGIQNAVFFGVYANTLNILLKLNEKSIHEAKNMDIFLAGSCGGFAQILITTPVESIKIQFQVKKPKRAEDRLSLRKFVLDTYRTYGFRKGFYRGFLLTGLRDVPTGGFYILTYDILDEWLQKYTSQYIAHCIAGGVAGFATYAPVAPIDIIKTKIQGDKLHNPRYRNTFHCIQRIYRAGGFYSFWRGFVPVCVRAFVCNAFIFVGYEYCISLFDQIKK